MKADIKKKLEIGLWTCNLIAFIIINLTVLRKIHWILMLITAVPLLITILCVIKNKYVDWNKKSPAIRPLLISLGVFIVSTIITLIPGVGDYIFVFFFISRFLSAVLSFVLFIRFVKVYNRAFREHQKEINLNKGQCLYKASTPVVWAFILILVWVVTVSFTDKMSTVNSPEKYDSVISDSDYEFFPDSLPDNADNKEFYQFPGFWLAGSKAYVRFETTVEYLEEYELQHESTVNKVTTTDNWIELHAESSKICKLITENYISNENCDVYVNSDGFCIQGYAINRSTNEIFIFYDGID